VISSISSGSKLKLIKHHYILWKVAEEKNAVSACVLTLRNLFWGVLKKLIYKEREIEQEIPVRL
jgi:teichuronic acid biosynthesis glycosyltransferase TuaG